jgi:methyltransferase (TIGR00027 family)
MHTLSSTLAAQETASRTAYDCAAVRAAIYAWTGYRSFDYLAADMVSGKSASLKARMVVALGKLGAARLSLAIVSRASHGADIFIFARQAVPDDLAREALDTNERTQVVVLGAGLDTSGLRIGAERRAAGKAAGRFFEVDLPATQAEKRRLVARLVQTRRDLSEGNLIYVPCSFGEAELGAALRGAGFDTSRPSIWIWSGVVHYLTDAAVRATVTQLRQLSAPGSKLFFDFIPLEAYEKPHEYGFATAKARFDKFGEVMSFGLSHGTEQMREWLRSQGFALVRTYTHVDMMALYEQKTGKPLPSKAPPWLNLCIAAV